MLKALKSEEKRSWLQKILDFIRNLINKVKGIDTSFEDELRSLEQKFTKMLNETTQNEKNTGEGVKSSVNDVIDLSKDNELSKRIGNLTGAPKYKIIQQYILEILGDQPITMSDGKKVIVTKNDAKHMAHGAWDKKTAQISQIKKLVENAELYAEEFNPIHDIFDYFCYYKANVRYQNKEFSIFLNVGQAKNNEGYRLYDITNKIRDTADRINGLGRPGGYALTNGISNERIPQTKANVNIKSSIPLKTNTEYLSAVENGDVETAQKMVDKAAKDAGYLLKGYHGSPNRFYIFERSKIGKTTDPGIYGRGFYFSDQESQAWEYANQNNKKGDVRSFFIKINNPFEIKSDDDYLAFEDIYMGPLAKAEADGEILSEERIGELLEEGTQKLIDMGYDGVIYYGKGQKEYVTFESEQSKLSDAVVYDDQGNVIPLSERFNEKKKDIRYSISSQSNKKSLPKYTKEQYNNFGWVRYNNILSAKQIKMLTEKIYELSERNIYFNQTNDGQYIIPIGEDYGLYDVLVYTNDDAINPKISQVIKLADFADGYLKETIWKDFLNGKDITEREIERKISDVRAVWGEESIIQNVPQNSPSFQEYENTRVKGNVSGQDSGRNGKRYDIGTVDTESERDTTGNTENDVKLLISLKNDADNKRTELLRRNLLKKEPLLIFRILLGQRNHIANKSSCQ